VGERPAGRRPGRGHDELTPRGALPGAEHCALGALPADGMGTQRTPSRGYGRGVVDAHYADPRLAAVYDLLDPDRSDLDVHARVVAEFGARSVLDVGCGTGTFACLLAGRGLDVTAVDPAAASLAVARRKRHADRVRWLLGDATSLPPLAVDVATMTANVAQVFLADDEWTATLTGVAAALRPGGRLVFESRDPVRQAWREWDRERTTVRTDAAGGVESWLEVTAVGAGTVSFRQLYVFAADGAVLTSESTLRFRTRAELAASVERAGLVVEEVRCAPDRPGRELVFVTRRPG
jgi:SAM-dependent methyltransferase